MKRQIGNKGVFSNIQLAILALTALLVFSLFLYKTYDKLSDRMQVQDCKNSIAAHSAIAKGSFSEIFTDIKCPTREVAIKKLKNTNKIIAEDMHRCWYIWGEGKGQYFEGEGTFCHVCAIYQFSEKGKTLKGLNEYLIQTDVPRTYAGETGGMKYIEYFQGYSSPNAEKKVDSKIQVPVELDNINTSERYATIFVYASGKDSIDKMLEGSRTTAATGLAMFGMIGGLGSASAAGAASAASTTTYFLAYTAAGQQFMWPIAASTAAAYGGTGAAVGGMTVATTTVTGTVLGLTPLGWAIIGTAAVGAGVWGIYTVLDTPDPEWMAYVAFRPYTQDDMKALGCEKMEVNQMSNAG